MSTVLTLFVLSNNTPILSIVSTVPCVCVNLIKFIPASSVISTLEYELPNCLSLVKAYILIFTLLTFEYRSTL